MRKKFCPKCGKDADVLYDGVCKDCLAKKENILSKSLPDTIKLNECKVCGKVFGAGKGHQTVYGAVEEAVTKHLKKKEIESASFRLREGVVTVTAIYPGGSSEEKDTNIAVKKITCKDCSLMKIGYFNSIIQIRGTESWTKEVLDLIEDIVGRLNKKNGMSFISKIEHIKQGYDIYIGSKFAARTAWHAVRLKYPVEVKITSKLGGSDGGKKIYRDTILIKLK